MALAAGALVDLALNPKVQDVAQRLITSLYGRIFTAKPVDAAGIVEGPVTDRQLLEQLLAAQPSNEEMAAAFSSLQAELRRGQQRLMIAVFATCALNIALLCGLILSRT
jgi:hypothetical protein